MAQLVKLEPGDILVLSNVGEQQIPDLRDAWETLSKALGLEQVIVFEGDVDLSKVPGDVAGFTHLGGDATTARVEPSVPGADSGDGGE